MQLLLTITLIDTIASTIHAVPTTNTCTIQQCLSDDGGILIGSGTTNRHERHVTFTSVQIREYSTILGDHPCCPSGPPFH